MTKRKLDGVISKALWVYVLLMGLFHLYTAVFGAFEAYLQRAIHLTWVLPMVFIVYPMFESKDGSPTTTVAWYDWILAAISTIPGFYIMFNYMEIVERMAGVDEVTMIQIILGTIIILTLIEATRRAVGVPIILVSLAFMSYCMYYLMTDIAAQNGLASITDNIWLCFKEAYKQLVEEMYLLDEGIYSSSLGVSATIVMIFLIFGGFLENSGVGEYFMEFAQAFTGTQAGGPAKIAVVSSCLFGSISGSAVANVYGTGTFTIPLMKRIGYKPYYAGAVEAVASSGGQIMPPVMGAGAFVMASFLNIQFSKVVIAALLPALLYYAAVMVMIHLTAKRDGLRGLNEDELPKKSYVLKRIYMMSPILLLIVLLLTGFTAQMSAAWGIVLAWLVSLPNPKRRMGPIGILHAVHDGAKGIPVVCTACASAGFVLGAVALSGIGPKIITVVLSLSGGIPVITLMLIAIVCLILGMGLPTTSAYILAASLCVPALGQLRFTPLAAHMFVFYYAIISNITPPVALAAYAAASIAEDAPNKTGWAACSLGFLAFVIPFAFCYDTGLLLQLDWLHNIISIMSGIALVFGVGFSFTGYCCGKIPMWIRTLFVAFGLAAMWKNPAVSFAGTVAIAALFLFCRKVYSDESITAMP